MTFERARALMNKGISRPTLFKMDIPAISGAANDYISFYCKSARLPEVVHESVSASGQGRVGVTRQQPSMVTFGKPMQITVIERSDYIVHQNFQLWFQQTSPPYNTLGNESQRMNYYDNFVTDIMLHKLEYPESSGKRLQRDMNTGKISADAYKVIFTATFKNAYPTSLGDINFDTESNNAMVQYNVDFNYETYHIDYEPFR